MNQWAADHTHSLAGGTPIVALEMYEHSYHIDYGAAAAKYVEAFMDNRQPGERRAPSREARAMKERR